MTQSSTNIIKLKDIIASVISVPALAYALYYIATEFNGSGLTYLDYLRYSVVLVFAGLGGFQIYIWTQNNNPPNRATPLCFIDRIIPFWPKWVWVYSVLYYVILYGAVIFVPNDAYFLNLVFGMLILIVLQGGMFYFIPTVCPGQWRDYKPNTPSTKFLAEIQKIAYNTNCFPSMHCSIAAYFAAEYWHLSPAIALSAVFLIGISCLFTKQHMFVDIPSGIAYGWGMNYLLV